MLPRNPYFLVIAFSLHVLPVKNVLYLSLWKGIPSSWKSKLKKRECRCRRWEIEMEREMQFKHRTIFLINIFYSIEACDLMPASADFSLNTKTVNENSCCYIGNNHSTYFWESVLAHQAKTQPQSIILEAFFKKDKNWQSADSKWGTIHFQICIQQKIEGTNCRTRGVLKISDMKCVLRKYTRVAK